MQTQYLKLSMSGDLPQNVKRRAVVGKLVLAPRRRPPTPTSNSAPGGSTVAMLNDVALLVAASERLLW